MINIQKFKAIIHEREQTDDEWAEGVQKCQEELVSVLCEDFDSTLQYLRSECTADEFSWISEVFDEIAIRTQSREFIAVLRILAEKYPEETEEYNIIPFIDSAECQLDQIDTSEVQ